MHLWLILVVLLGLLNITRALAHDPDAEVLEVPEVSVVGERPVAASSQQFIPDKEYLLQPQGRPAQVLRLIPGFIAVEHSGGAGKADQYFLRGFDADHGTDVAFFTDGMPINLRSHAHGQGYTDLNFIIPETIEGTRCRTKALICRSSATSTTAGAVNFRTRQVVKEGVVQAAGGQFDTQTVSAHVLSHEGQDPHPLCRRGLLHQRAVSERQPLLPSESSRKDDHEFVQARRTEPNGYLSEGSMECVRRNSITGRHGWHARPFRCRSIPLKAETLCEALGN